MFKHNFRDHEMLKLNNFNIWAHDICLPQNQLEHLQMLVFFFK